MKALWLRELQSILESPGFISWWQSLVDAENLLVDVCARHDELLAQVTLMDFRSEFTQKNAIDSLALAGEHVDTAARLLAEAAEIDNKSYEVAARFESQRIAASDIFSRMGAVEHNLLGVQAELEELKTAIAGVAEEGRREDLRRIIKKKELERLQLQKEFREVSELYQREDARKIVLWEEVERMWARSLDVNLGVSERRIKSKRERRQAERLFGEAEQHKRSAEALRTEAGEAARKKDALGAAIGEIRSSAHKLFGCLAGDEFLYWPRREDVKEIYCVPINDHQEGFNIELRARNIYLINQQRGVEFIEPLPPPSDFSREEDQRIDDFFLRGRPVSRLAENT